MVCIKTLVAAYVDGIIIWSNLLLRKAFYNRSSKLADDSEESSPELRASTTPGIDVVGFLLAPSNLVSGGFGRQSTKPTVLRGIRNGPLIGSVEQWNRQSVSSLGKLHIIDIISFVMSA